MKKTLIAALIAGIPAVAAADVTVYGIIKGGVESVDSNGARATTIDDLGSRIGFKGSEDLGSGLKAIWQVEQGFNIDDGSEYKSGMGSFANRQSFIGLASEFGTLRLGNISNYADSSLGSVDAWEYNSDALGLGIFTRDQARVKNAVRYDSPEFYGVKASFLYGTKEDKKGVLDEGKNWEDTDRETYNLGLSYDYANFFGKYSYEQQTAMSFQDAGDEKVQEPKNRKQWLELGYDANNLFVAVAYKRNKGDASILPFAGDDATWYSAAGTGTAGIDANANDGDTFKTNEIALTATYTLGNFTPKFSYAQGSNIKVGGNDLTITAKDAAGDVLKTMKDTGYKQFIIGTDYALSKRTILGAQYGQLKLEDGAAALYGLKDGEDTIKAFGVNMIHKF